MLPGPGQTSRLSTQEYLTTGVPSNAPCQLLFQSEDPTLSHTMQLVRSGMELPAQNIPPPSLAELPAIVQFVRVSKSSAHHTPPPSHHVEFPEIVQWSKVGEPW